MLQHNAKTKIENPVANTQGAKPDGNIDKIKRGPQDSVATATENSKRTAAQILYPAKVIG